MATLQASVAPLQGAERFAAQQVQADVSHRVRIRYTSGITSQMRVFHDLHSNANSQGTATGGGANYILLENNGTQADDSYNGYGIVLVDGTGSGQFREISDYDHTGNGSGERYAQVSANWSTSPDNTSVYRICTQYLNIAAVLNLDERNVQMELLCTEAV